MVPSVQNLQVNHQRDSPLSSNAMQRRKNRACRLCDLELGHVPRPIARHWPHSWLLLLSRSPVPTILNSQFTNRLSIPVSAVCPLPFQPRLMLTVALLVLLLTENLEMVYSGQINLGWGKPAEKLKWVFTSWNLSNVGKFRSITSEREGTSQHNYAACTLSAANPTVTSPTARRKT